ncbi:RNA pseudouridylate synthase domain-containing protein 1-like [Eupeodes corollae]|uniref:RNA pseudouridylate synthase domain-containing protein 1-like n=1 Tax=Eupeodes corollae TaxID=290404 RepID=UPI00249349E4|nr:RNA pseudouridylate synthase domain-containing protein 1-like [Eupeodes corollae]
MTLERGDISAISVKKIRLFWVLAEQELFSNYSERAQKDRIDVKAYSVVLLQLFNETNILYQSKHFLVVNKPPDILINSNDCTKSTVQTMLRNQFPDLSNPKLTHEFYFAHRLDFSTSGILCIPLHKQACASLSKSFENHKCKKYYIAIVNGHVAERQDKSLDINLAIGEDIRFESTSKKMCTEFESEFCKNPRKSQTHLRVLALGNYKNRKISKVLLQPITGRRHQLRLHCSAIGHPILGDFTYGSQEDRKMHRMYLHAIRIIAPNEYEDLHIHTDDPFIDPDFCFEAVQHSSVLNEKNFDDML